MTYDQRVRKVFHILSDHWGYITTIRPTDDLDLTDSYILIEDDRYCGLNVQVCLHGDFSINYWTSSEKRTMKHIGCDDMVQLFRKLSQMGLKRRQ